MRNKDKTYNFEFKVGDNVSVIIDMKSQVLLNKGMIIEQVDPFKYPLGQEIRSKNTLLLPGTRKIYQPTRKVSYMVKFFDDLYLWATEECLKKE